MDDQISTLMSIDVSMEVQSALSEEGRTQAFGKLPRVAMMIYTVRDVFLVLLINLFSGSCS